MGKKLVNFLLFQLAYAFCLWASIKTLPWLGLLSCALVVLLHFFLCPSPKRAEFFFILSAFIFGTTIDWTLLQFGIFHHIQGPVVLGTIPEWIIALWLIFPTTIGISLNWMEAFPKISAFLGFIFGPLSYRFGQVLGIIQFGEPEWQGLLVMGFIWATIMPGLFWWHRFLFRRFGKG